MQFPIAWTNVQPYLLLFDVKLLPGPTQYQTVPQNKNRLAPPPNSKQFFVVKFTQNSRNDHLSTPFPTNWTPRTPNSNISTPQRNFHLNPKKSETTQTAPTGVTRVHLKLPLVWPKKPSPFSQLLRTSSNAQAKK